MIDTFSENIKHYGPPESSLTDDGSVSTSRFTKVRNGFEYLLTALGIRQKSGSPGHPQTQGKVERLRQTQRIWLTAQPPDETLSQLQQQLLEFQHAYNTKRPDRSLGGRTPDHAKHVTIKASPRRQDDSTHYRIRLDRHDPKGKASLRRAGRMHHLGSGAINARKPVPMLVDDTTVSEPRTGEVLSQHLIQPDKSYWADLLKPQVCLPNK